jgi:hypothetical protein
MEDDDLVLSILAGLDFEWNPLVITMNTKTGTVSLSELYSRLINFKNRLDIQNK